MNTERSILIFGAMRYSIAHFFRFVHFLPILLKKGAFALLLLCSCALVFPADVSDLFTTWLDYDGTPDWLQEEKKEKLIIFQENFTAYINDPAFALLANRNKAFTQQAAIIRNALPQHNSRDISYALFQFATLEKNAAEKTNTVFLFLLLFFIAFIIGGTLILYRMSASLQESKMKQEQASWFAQSVIKAQEIERRRILLEIHDTVMQDFRYYGLELAQNRLTNTALPEIAHGILKSVSQLRSICMNLQPPDLSGKDFTATVQTFCNKIQADTGVSCYCKYTKSLDLTAISEKTCIHLYRIIQEGIANSIKHASPSEICVAFRKTAERHRTNLVCYVTDDGTGFSYPAKAPRNNVAHFGIQGMQERAKLIGAEFAITSNDEIGTEIKITVPLSGTHEKNDKEQP